MVEEYELEELADEAISELRTFIDIEKQIVKGEHDLVAKLDSWDYIIGHLDERIPPEASHLHALSNLITELLLRLRSFIKKDEFRDLRIMAENTHGEWQLEGELQQRDFKAARKSFLWITDRLSGHIKLREGDIKVVHSKFMFLMKLMKRSTWITAIEDDLTLPEEKEKCANLVQYYFLQIYKFAKAYERIFRNLWKEERVQSGKAKRTYQKME